MQVINANRPGRLSALVGGLVRTVFVAAIVATAPVQAEITVPIKGQLIPERVSADIGTIVTFRLEVSTTVAFARVAARLKVPDGMTLVTGTAQAEIVNFTPGETRVFEYGLRLDTAGEKKVWAEAEALGIAPAILRKRFLGVVNPEDDGTSKAMIRRDRDGTSYQVQGISRKPSP